MATSSRHRGWRWDDTNDHLEIMVDGTQVGSFRDCGNDLVLDTNGLTITAGGLTVTAGGLTVTAGGIALDAGDLSVDGDCVTGLFLVDTSEDNIKIGGTAAHATTPGTQSMSFFAGTAPNGTLACGATLFAGCDTCVIEIRAEDSGGTATTL